MADSSMLERIAGKSQLVAQNLRLHAEDILQRAIPSDAAPNTGPFWSAHRDEGKGGECPCRQDGFATSTIARVTKE